VHSIAFNTLLVGGAANAAPAWHAGWAESRGSRPVEDRVVDAFFRGAIVTGPLAGWLSHIHLDSRTPRGLPRW
jgi:hypothetical protein